VFANLDQALAAAGASFADVIKLVRVSVLAMPDLEIEIEAWAICADLRRLAMRYHAGRG
jgi:hypothetical protein